MLADRYGLHIQLSEPLGLLANDVGALHRAGSKPRWDEQDR